MKEVLEQISNKFKIFKGNGASADATPIAENATSVAMIDFLFIIYCFLFRE